MKYLLIDTSTSTLTAALATENEILSFKQLTNMNEHSKYALSSIEEIFKDAGLKPNDIDRIIVANGPGSFTGVRIGVTIAKTYAWALKKDVIAVSNLALYALGYDNYDYYVVLLDARRDHVYAAIFDKEYNYVMADQYISIDSLFDNIKALNGSFVIIGDIDIKDYKCQPIKVDVLKTIYYYKNKELINPHMLKPSYLKRVEAEEKLLGVE